MFPHRRTGPPPCQQAGWPARASSARPSPPPLVGRRRCRARLARNLEAASKAAEIDVERPLEGEARRVRHRVEPPRRGDPHEPPARAERHATRRSMSTSSASCSPGSTRRPSGGFVSTVVRPAGQGTSRASPCRTSTVTPAPRAFSARHGIARGSTSCLHERARRPEARPLDEFEPGAAERIPHDVVGARRRQPRDRRGDRGVRRGGRVAGAVAGIVPDCTFFGSSSAASRSPRSLTVNDQSLSVRWFKSGAPEAATRRATSNTAARP